MKKISLFLLSFLILMGQFSYKTTLVLGQEQQEDDKSAIREVVRIFYESAGKEDFTTALSQVSPNFTCVINGETMDYNKHEAFLRKASTRTYKKFFRLSLLNIKTTNIEIKGNKASAAVSYDWKGFNRDLLEDKTGQKNRLVHFAKENGAWKITWFGNVDGSLDFNPDK